MAVSLRSASVKRAALGKMKKISTTVVVPDFTVALQDMVVLNLLSAP